MTVAWPGADAERLVADVAATPRLLVALDFDGTLAPLVDEPMAARATADAADAVRALSRASATVVAFVSGRSLRDLRVIAEHDDDSPVLLAGSHGAEYWMPGEGESPVPDDAEAHDLRERLTRAADDLVAAVPGVWIERKTLGFAVAGRLATPEDEARANVLVDELIAAEAPHWRRRVGHNIVEYSFRHEGKDTAVARLRARVGATAVMFAGDDVTDEDALASLDAGDLGIRVGEADTAAAVRVADTVALAALLRGVAQARTPDAVS